MITSGRAVGFNHNGAPYFYLRNLQNDVVAVTDSSGIVVAQYAYDAYGNVLSETGPMAAINPIKYRGYYHDAETNWYWLETRYYVPQWRRFLNADTFFVAGEDVLCGSNMYAYCNGNPVMFVDPTGRGIFSFWSDLLPNVKNGLGKAADFVYWLVDGLGQVGNFVGQTMYNASRHLPTIANMWEFAGRVFGGLALVTDKIALPILNGINSIIPVKDPSDTSDWATIVRGSKGLITMLIGGAEAFVAAGDYVIPAFSFMYEVSYALYDLFTDLGPIFGWGGSDDTNVAIHAEGEEELLVPYGDEVAGLQSVGAIGIRGIRVEQVNLYHNSTVAEEKTALLYAYALNPDGTYDSVENASLDVKWTKSASTNNIKTEEKSRSSALITAQDGTAYIEVRAEGKYNGKTYGSVYVVSITQARDKGVPAPFGAVAKVDNTRAYMRPDIGSRGISLNITKAQPCIANLDVRGEITVAGKVFYFGLIRQKDNTVSYEKYDVHYRFVEKDKVSKVVWPAGRTQPSWFFGHRSDSFHSGVDIGTGGLTEYNINSNDIPVYAIMDGTVYYAERSQGARGHVVILQHNIAGLGAFYTLYQHLRDKNNNKDELPIEGAKYEAGQKIAYIGASGTFADPPRSAHLHFELMPTLPSLATGSYITPEPVNPLIKYHQAHDTRDPGYTTKIWNPNPFFTLDGNIRLTSEYAVYTFKSVNPNFNWYELKDGSWPDKYSRANTYKY